MIIFFCIFITKNYLWIILASAVINSKWNYNFQRIIPKWLLSKVFNHKYSNHIQRTIIRSIIELLYFFSAITIFCGFLVNSMYVKLNYSRILLENMHVKLWKLLFFWFVNFIIFRKWSMSLLSNLNNFCYFNRLRTV